MATTTIKAPQTGTLQRIGDCSSGNHCGNCPHPTCGSPAYLPGDISTASGVRNIYLEVDFSVIKSVSIVQEDICCDNGTPNQYTKSVLVQLYTGTNLGGTHVGYIRYGHVTASVTGMVNLSSGELLLGTIPTGTYGTCYSGQHVHMEVGSNASLASGVLSLCGKAVTKGSTPLYVFTY